MAVDAARRLALLNPWQHGFPLVPEPFAAIAQASACSSAEVIAAYAALQREGALSRIGGVFGRGAGGAATLAAMAVPRDALEAVARCVDAQPGVNHNYEREHRLNLWFVATGTDAAAVEASLRTIEQASGLPVLRLPMERAYRIDLGFDLRARTATAPMRAAPEAAPVAPADRPLAALVEGGLPLVEQPYAHWATACGTTTDAVLARLADWLARGTLRRFGAIVRHHELGFAANAMAVFDVPAADVDARGSALAELPGITLAYRRRRAEGWPYNLYAMVHGRDRTAVHEVLARATAQAGLAGAPGAVLFSARRFKQTGARCFRAPHGEAHDAVA